MSDVLCVGAHPDDVELGMGATVHSMVRQGLEVAIVDLTDGEPTRKGDRPTRLQEARAAAEVLGASTRRTLTQRNRELQDTVGARRELAEVIRELRPTRMFVPYAVDAHPDHIAAAAISEAARFYGKFVPSQMAGEPHYVPRLYHYPAVHLRLHLRPSFILDSSDGLEAQLRALRCYRSQFIDNPLNAHFLSGVETEAAYWGRLIGVRYGEPFFSREEIGLTSIAHLT